MARKQIKSTIRWPYDGNLQRLYVLMMQRIEFDKVTLEMTEDEYNSFSDDLDYDSDANESFYGSHFRPLNDLTDTNNLEWVFSGKLDFKIKLVEE
jgi:hypothetical protein